MSICDLVLTGVEVGIGSGGFGDRLFWWRLVFCGKRRVGPFFLFWFLKDSFVCEFLMKMEDRLSVSGCSARS